MKIVIDMQAAQGFSRMRGIGRYTMDIVRAIVKNNKNHDIYLLLNSSYSDSCEEIRYEFLEKLGPEKIVSWSPIKGVNNQDENQRWKVELSEKLRECVIANLNPDLVFNPSMFEGYDDNLISSIGQTPYKIRTATTNHDLIPLIWSNIYLKSSKKYENFYKNRLQYLSKSDVIFSISKSAAQEAKDYLKFPDEKNIITYEGVKDCFKKLKNIDHIEKAKLSSWGILGKFVLYSGAADQRKNHLRLIKAFSNIASPLRDSYQLVIAGNISDDYVLKIKEYSQLSGLSETSLIIIKDITDHEMVLLYNTCAFFVFPSWHEGFGLPALEAMACGAPVIAANTSSLPEVVDNKEALFDPFSTKEISALMQKCMVDENFLAKLKKFSVTQCQKFSWDKTAQIIIDYISRLPENSSYYKTDQIYRYISTEAQKLMPANINNDDKINTALSISKSLNKRKTKRLYLDISELVQRDAKTGVQRVVRGLLKELLCANIDYEVRPVYASYNNHSYKFANKFTHKFIKDISTFKFSTENESYIDFIPGDIFFGLDLQHDVVIQQSDFFRNARVSGAQVYFLVHDLLPVLLPHVFEPHMYRVHTEWLQELSRNHGVVCVSKTVAKEYIEWLDSFAPSRPGFFKVGWSHNAYDIEGSIPSKGIPTDAYETLKKLNDRISFLMVGTIEPRKGYQQVLLTFEKLWAQGNNINLIIVGKQGWDMELFSEQVRVHEELGNRLFWMNGISDEYLEMIYKNSNCLIAASEGEGYGLPLIEAAKYDLPIIARDIPVFREVAGNYATYFSGFQIDDLALVIEQWLCDFKNGNVFSTRNIPKISWKQSSITLLDNIINNNWFHEWKSDGRIRYHASDENLLIEAGEKSGPIRKTNGSRGYMLFGQYEKFLPGNYKVIVRGEIGKNGPSSSFSDVSAEKGSIIFHAEPLKQIDTGIIASYNFKLDQSYDDVEIRVWVDEHSDLIFRSIEVIDV